MSVIPFFFFDGSQTHCVSFVDLYRDALDTELGTDQTTLFTIERRKRAVNDAMYAWVRQTQCIKRDMEILIQNGIGEYAIEDHIPDFMEFAEDPYVRVTTSTTTRYLQGQDLPERDPDWLNREEPGWKAAPASTPSSWYIDENQNTFVGLSPKPKVGVGETWTLIVPYLAAPNRMTMDTDFPFTIRGTLLKRLCPWSRALTFYAAAQLEPLRKNYEAVADQTAKWNAVIAQYFVRKQAQRPNQINLERNYYKTSNRPPDPRRWP